MFRAVGVSLRGIDFLAETGYVLGMPTAVRIWEIVNNSLQSVTKRFVRY